MKTLHQEIEEIKNAASSRKFKEQALIKLGLREHEAMLLLDTWATETRTRRSERFTFTFGVEIECDIAQSIVARTFTSNGVNYHYEGYNHVDNRTHYKFVTDGSLSGNNPIECVSPVLNGSKSGFDSLKACCKSLNEGGARVNRSCGLHVHIGGRISDAQFVNVFRNYQKLERLIDTFMASSRRANENGYCKSLQGLNLNGCSNFRDVQYRCNHCRYYKVNAMAFTRHRTIEFRQHQGTTDYAKISNWVKFCAKLVQWSKSNLFAHEITSIDAIPFLNEEEKAFFKARAEQFANI